MRSVQVVEKVSEEIKRADHVIGIDESGNVTDSNPFVLVAVRCPRENGELLAELLIEHDLIPWQGKSQTLAANVPLGERNRRVEALIDSFESHPISWSAAVGYQQGSIHHKAAGVCVLAKKTITESTAYSGDSILLPDGATNMYGNSQKHLRVQAAQVFDGSFESAFGAMYVTGLPKADLTYPEVAAADYLAGYIRSGLTDGRSVDDFPDSVMWFKKDWREPIISPLPFYQIAGVNGSYGNIEHTRIAAWIKGRQPDGNNHDASSQWRNTIQMLESNQLQQYLSDEFRP